ncbi:ABC transporter permease, partial [Abiotrophia defectiva]
LPPMGFEVIKREFMKDKLALLSLIVFILILLFLYVAPFFLNLESATKVQIFNRYMAPGSVADTGHTYLLGADEGGRDVLAQLILGGRNSITIALIVTALTMIIGLVVGIVSGYYGGRVDNFIMRLVDFVMIIPGFILFITLNTILKANTVLGISLTFSVIYWTSYARLFRTRTLSEASKDYINASKTMGTRDWKIMLTELLPNISSLIITQLVLSMAGNIGLETGLSYLGFGLPIGTPSLGTLIGTAKTADIIENKQWVWLPAALFILVLMLCINYIGQAVQRSTDARQRLG